MISLILPYWQRQAAADVALSYLARQYAGLDLEVIVIDDGSFDPFRKPASALDIRVITLPQKLEAKSPVSCWNVGVRLARGDTIALSCIEVIHREPVLAEMAAELERLGEKGYVLAAAWCPELAEWHCHSKFRSAGAPALPEGCGRAFLGLMRRSLYQAAGGFDEDYREGAGYEDIDFVYRLLRAGAQFKIRDDLVVTHPKSGASISWGAHKFARNQQLLERKWANGHP